VISHAKPVKAEANDSPIVIIDGGLSDEDETIGIEREAAVASPPKGKVRAISSVSK
jgi:hypothetical protein